jgi:hypothetical protein
MDRDTAVTGTINRLFMDEERGDAQEEAPFARGSSQALTLASDEASADMPRALSSQRLSLSSNEIPIYSVLSTGDSIVTCSPSMTVDEAPVHEVEDDRVEDIINAPAQSTADRKPQSRES